MMKSSDISKASIIVNTIIDIERRIFRIDEYYRPNEVWWLMHDDDSIMLDKGLTEEIIQLVKTRLKEQKQNCLNELERLGVDYVDDGAK